LVANAIGSLFPGLVKPPGIVDDRDSLSDAAPVVLMWPVGSTKPFVGLVRDTDDKPYWTKYERFLKHNQIPFEYYNIHESTWRAGAERFDVIIWRPRSEPAELFEARKKIYFLERCLNKICYPSFDTVMTYEDKILQYELLKHYGFPVIDTFISHDYEEIERQLHGRAYPTVSKASPGSGSFGVELVENAEQADKIVRAAFSFAGRQTYWPYLNQKDYVFFQKYQKNEGYDLRIIVTGDVIIGYYRDVPAGDFRASGMGLVRWAELPADAIDLARKVARRFAAITLAVDMLRDPDTGKLSVIELSSFTRIDGDEGQRDGVPGIYILEEDGSLSFNKGKYWLQELALKEFFAQVWLKRPRPHPDEAGE
jgi:glutathione synthase/RimK-type ligase-like ATP-grasp enzyme